MSAIIVIVWLNAKKKKKGTKPQIQLLIININSKEKIHNFLRSFSKINQRIPWGIALIFLNIRYSNDKENKYKTQIRSIVKSNGNKMWKSL